MLSAERIKCMPDASDEVGLSDEEADEIHSLLEYRSSPEFRRIRAGYQCNLSAEALVVTPGSPGNSSFKKYQDVGFESEQWHQQESAVWFNGSRRKLLLYWLPV